MRLFVPGFIAVTVLGVGLAACGGGTHAAIPAASQGASQSQTGTGSNGTKVTLRIDVPMTGSGSSRRPKYLSSATSSLAYIVTDSSSNVIGENCLNLGSAVQSCQTPEPTSPPVTQFGAVSTCQSAGLTAPVACEFDFNLNISSSGSYNFTVATYDNTLAAPCDPRPATSTCTASNRHALSLSTFSQTLNVGTTNTVDVTLGGVPAGIAVRPLTPGYLQQQGAQLKLWGPSSQQVTVEPLDADGNIIVGTGAPSLSLTSASNAVLIVSSPSPTSLSPNVYTLQAPTSGSPGVISAGILNLTATATMTDGAKFSDGTSALVATVPVTIAHSVLFVSDSNSSTSTGTVYEYYDGNATGTPNATISLGTGSGVYASALAVDGNGTLYVGTTQVPGEVRVYPAGSTTPSETLISVGMIIQSLATDANGNLYVGDASGEQIVAFSPGSTILTAPYLTISGTNTGIDQPTGIAVGADGTVYSAQSSNGSVITYAATTGSTITSATVNLVDGFLSGAAKYVAVSASKLYVSPPSVGIIDECPLPLVSNTNCTATELVPSANSTTGVAVDASGAVYVAGYSNGQNGTVTLFPAGSTSGSVVVSGLLAPSSPNFLTVLPRAIAP